MNVYDKHTYTLLLLHSCTMFDRGVVYFKDSKMSCLPAGEPGCEKDFTFSICYYAPTHDRANCILKFYDHCWDYFKISYGDDLAMSMSVCDENLLNGRYLLIECRPKNKTDLLFELRHQLWKEGFHYDRSFTMLHKIRVKPNGPFVHPNPPYNKQAHKEAQNKWILRSPRACEPPAAVAVEEDKQANDLTEKNNLNTKNPGQVTIYRRQRVKVPDTTTPASQNNVW